MSKLVTALMATGGTVTASVGGVLLVNKYGFSQGDGDAVVSESAGGESGREGDESQQIERTGAEAGGTPGGVVGGTGSSIKNTPGTESETYDLSRFATDKGGDCVKHIFGDDLDFANDGSPIDPNNQINEDFSTQTSEAVQSCLVVSWEKKHYANADSDKWKGYFRWVWAFSAGYKGFVLFLTTKGDSLGLEVGYYYIGKNPNSPEWQVKEKKEIKGDKSITQDNFGRAFSTVGTSISNLLSKDSQSNWGFVKDANDISNFCDNGSCGALNNDSTTSFKESFLWKKGGTGSTVTDWMGNYSTWFTEMFTGGDLHLGNFKGSWDKSPIPTSK